MQPINLGVVVRKSFANMHCSVAQCLEVVGEWWSMLIVRASFLGVIPFD
jgi:DNA-binding HxlR family transcriptional regulator